MAGGIHPEITLPHTQEWELYMRCPITRQGIADLRTAKATDTRLRAALEGA